MLCSLIAVAQAWWKACPAACPAAANCLAPSFSWADVGQPMSCMTSQYADVGKRAGHLQCQSPSNIHLTAREQARAHLALHFNLRPETRLHFAGCHNRPLLKHTPFPCQQSTLSLAPFVNECSLRGSLAFIGRGGMTWTENGGWWEAAEGLPTAANQYSGKYSTWVRYTQQEWGGAKMGAEGAEQRADRRINE